MDKINHCRKIVKEQISYTAFEQNKFYRIELVDELVELMTEIFMMPDEAFERVNGTEKSIAVIKSRFCKINQLHIEYVLDSMQKFEQICTAIAYALADYVQAQPKPVAPVQLPEKKKYVKVLVDGLAVRKRASWDDSAVDHKVQANEVFTIAEGPIKVGGGSMYKLKSGLHITASEKYVSVYEK